MKIATSSAITLVSKDNIDGPVKTSVQRNILGTMTVKNLKNLAQKLLKIPSMRQEIVFLTNDLDYENVMVLNFAVLVLSALSSPYWLYRNLLL